MDSCADPLYSNLPSILDLLRKGLASRVTAVSVAPVVRQQVCVKLLLFDTLLYYFLPHISVIITGLSPKFKVSI